MAAMVLRNQTNTTTNSSYTALGARKKGLKSKKRPLIESVLTTSISKPKGFAKLSVFLKQVSLLNPLARTNFVAFFFRKNNRKEPQSSVRFWAATGVW